MEALVHAVVVPAAALFALLVRQRLPGAMRMSRRELGTGRVRAEPALAHGARDGDVEVAVEAITLVEAADREQRVAPGGQAVPLDRVAVSRGHLFEVLQVGGPQTPWPDHARAVVERAFER